MSFLSEVRGLLNGSTIALIREERIKLEKAASVAADGANKIASVNPTIVRHALEEILAKKPEHLPLLNNMVTNIGGIHRNVPLLQAALAAGVPAWIFGDAGSGKTTAASKAADALGMEFRFISVCPTTSKSDLLGYKDAVGNYHRTAFRDIFEFGGIFLIDESDTGNPAIMTIFNAALANSACSFPDGNIKKHPKALFIAAANTIGRGANIRYVGRNALDATTLDRFVFVRMDLDENLEGTFVGMPFDQSLITNISDGGQVSPKDWLMRVRQVRHACAELGLEIIISQRATINGAKLIGVGVGRNHLEEMCLWKGLAETDRKKVQQYLQSKERKVA